MAPTRLERQADALLCRAEATYDPKDYARALEVIERLPSGKPENIVRRAMVMHALAELRGHRDLLLQAITEYERAAATGRLPARLAQAVPDLVADCWAQLREIEGVAG